MDAVVVVACSVGLVIGLILAVVPQWPQFRLWQLFGVITLLACLIGLGRASIHAAREAAVEASCHDWMFQIALALDEYRAHNGVYLPRSALDADGRMVRWPEILSWYLRYEHADSPTVLAEHFRCPSGARYLLVVGPGTIVQDQAVTPQMVSDGLANTLVAIEAAELPAPQSEDCELTLDDLDRIADDDGAVPATNIHPAGRGLVFADGAVYRLLKPLSAAQLRSLMTIDGGETISRNQLERDGYLVCLREPFP